MIMTQAATDIGTHRGSALFDRTPYFHATQYASGGRGGAPEFSVRFIQRDTPSEFDVAINEAKPFKMTDSELAQMSPEQFRDLCIEVATKVPQKPEAERQKNKEYAAEELDAMTTAELQDLLTSMGRPTYGNKAGLTRRVLETQEIRRNKAAETAKSQTVQA
jgi:hypothetical protein